MADNGTKTEEKPKELTSAQLKVIPHILAERHLEDAAKASGVGLRTIQRWMKDHTFWSAVKEAEATAIDAATRRLVVLSDSAIDALRDVLKNELIKPSIKVRAALGILDSMVKMRDLRNLETRLVALEQLFYGHKDPDEY